MGILQTEVGKLFQEYVEYVPSCFGYCSSLGACESFYLLLMEQLPASQ